MKSFVLPFWMLLLLSACASRKALPPKGPEQSKFERELVTFTKESRSWEKRCEDFATAAGKELKSLSPSRSVALLKRYPGLPPATRKVYDLVYKELGRFPLAETSQFYTAESCKLYQFFELFNAVVSAISARNGLKVDASLRRELLTLALERVRQELKGPTHSLPIMVSASMLNSLVDDGFVYAKQPLRQELKRLQDDAYALSLDVKKWRAKMPEGGDFSKMHFMDFDADEWRSFNDALLLELRKSDALRVRVLAAANKL